MDNGSPIMKAGITAAVGLFFHTYSNFWNKISNLLLISLPYFGASDLNEKMEKILGF